MFGRNFHCLSLCVVSNIYYFNPDIKHFRHDYHIPLKLLKEQILIDIPAENNLLDFVSKMKTKLHDVCEIAKSNLSTAQIKMKTWYDRKSWTRSFNAGDKVLILLPMTGNCLKPKFHGPYEIQHQINDVSYNVKTPDRMRKTRLCHINMIKEYRDRKKRVKQPVAPLLINVTSEEGTTDNHDQNVDKFVEDR